MGTKNYVMLKTHIDSINLCFANVFVYENVLWALASLWVFICNYVFSSMGMILTYIFRFQRKNEHPVALAQAEQSKTNQFEDYEIDGFIEELANLLFPRFDDFHVASEEEIEGETENSVLVEINSYIQKVDEKREVEIDCCVLKEKESHMNEGGDKREGRKEGFVFMECVSDVNEGVLKIDENETECSVFMECDSNFHQDGWKRHENVQEEQEEKTDSTTRKCQLVPRKEIGCFDFEEEPMALSFTFRENFASQNISDIAKKELSEHNLEESHVAQQEEEEGYVQDQGMFTSNSTYGSSFQFGGSEPGDDGYLLHNDNYNKEGYECKSVKPIEGVEETQSSCDREVSHESHAGVDTLKTECKNEKEGSSYNREETYGDNLEKTEETKWEDEMDEMDYDEDDEFEWEHDELVEQLRLEVRKARQGGLATILEEEGEENVERESPKVDQELKPLSIEEKMEYKDHIVEIQKVYRCYSEKIRKLDVLNYQAMHAIGLLQLKDPLKLMLVPKSTVQNAKSRNLWPRKAQKHTSDPMLKLVHELHRDLELVYVGQVCLSWEILCWQHMKIHELKKYDSQWPRRYNLVAGEFQLFQVLLQRFVEDEPFQQGPRIQNYIKNRCVIRNLLQIPAIKDDNTKDKKKIRWGEEDVITSDRLAHVIMESMHVFWEFVKADKDYGNVFHKVSSHQNGNEVEETEISDLLGDIQTQLQKKERKLKDKVKIGNCIVRKFQKRHEEKIKLDHEHLLAQVGLRLISRVLNMKNLRKDQLVWCSEKLNRIKFVGTKIQVEPSFLFFPC